MFLFLDILRLFMFLFPNIETLPSTGRVCHCADHQPERIISFDLGHVSDAEFGRRRRLLKPDPGRLIWSRRGRWCDDRYDAAAESFPTAVECVSTCAETCVSTCGETVSSGLRGARSVCSSSALTPLRVCSGRRQQQR